jgi:hypothetical protein
VAPIDNVVDALMGNVDGIGQLTLGQPHRIQEFRQKRFPRVCGDGDLL